MKTITSRSGLAAAAGAAVLAGVLGVFAPYIKIDGEEVLIVREDEVLAVLA